ncbi:MAG TPA: hypothetical protein VLA33_05550 [Gemmatimonadota bacterium]|nr:hypothetical protein [Gemmatimonadota bacterium]
MRMLPRGRRARQAVVAGVTLLGATVRWWKFQESSDSYDPVAPFIDPDGYRAFVDDTERRFRAVGAEHDDE